MYRGSHTLFTDVFNEVPTPPASPKRKGRSAELNDLRNEFLLSRYYFYSSFFDRKLAYNWIIETVAKECFLSPVTIPEVIDANYNLLMQIRKSSPSITDLKRKYPHVVWDTKMLLGLN